MPRSLTATTHACVVCKYASFRNRSSVAMGCSIRRGAGDHEILVLGMLCEPPLHVGTRGDDRHAFGARVSDGGLGESFADAAAAQAGGHFGMNKLERKRPDPFVDELSDAFGQGDPEAVVRAVILNVHN